jgi:hypothetical protein
MLPAPIIKVLLPLFIPVLKINSRKTLFDILKDNIKNKETKISIKKILTGREIFNRKYETGKKIILETKIPQKIFIESLILKYLHIIL